jgi:hypothetical protein
MKYTMMNFGKLAFFPIAKIIGRQKLRNRYKNAYDYAVKLMSNSL